MTKTGKLKHREVLGTYHAQCWIEGDNGRELSNTIPHLFIVMADALRSYLSSVDGDDVQFLKQLDDEISKAQAVFEEQLKSFRTSFGCLTEQAEAAFFGETTEAQEVAHS